jgi:hypothetical protein
MASASTPTTAITDPSPQRAMKLDHVHDLKIESAGSGSEVPERQYTKDFGLIPIPLHLRYDPSKPFHFGIVLNVAFGFASTFSESDLLFNFLHSRPETKLIRSTILVIANLYYCQPLLSKSQVLHPYLGIFIFPQFSYQNLLTLHIAKSRGTYLLLDSCSAMH